MNVHGGFPSSFVMRGLRQLRGFSKLASSSEAYTRVYPTNACAGPSLHDTVMDARIGAMADSAWHPWSHAAQTTRTIFSLFQRHGYRTHLFGAFGLDSRLDPRVHMHCDPLRLTRALEAYGVDECDAQDSAFTCQLAAAHDAEALFKTLRCLRARKTRQPLFIMVNLLGCQDAHKCTMQDLDPSARAARHDARADDARALPRTVLKDDARSQGGAANSIDALRCAAALSDWVRGETVARDASDVTRVVSELNRLCWRVLEHIGEGLERIIDEIEAGVGLDATNMYVYSDHALSMYEHGEMCEAPWDSCLRSFLIRRAAGANPRTVDTPHSLSMLPSMVLRDAGIDAGWSVAPSPPGICVTLGLALCWVARASFASAVSPLSLRTLFHKFTLSHNSRGYGIAVWFSVNDLLAANGYPSLTERKLEWVNPVYGRSLRELSHSCALQVFELTTDPDESDDLSTSPDWLCSPAASQLEKKMATAMECCGLATLSLRIPENVADIEPERLSLCSAQLHCRVRRSLASPQARKTHATAHAGTQTAHATLDELVLDMCRDAGLTDLPAHVRQAFTPDMTLFLPEGSQPKWPPWMPAPLDVVCTTPASFAEAASARSQRSGRVSVRVSDDRQDVLVGDCRVNLDTLRLRTHEHGATASYTVRPPGTAESTGSDKADSAQTPRVRRRAASKRPTPSVRDAAAVRGHVRAFEMDRNAQKR